MWAATGSIGYKLRYVPGCQGDGSAADCGMNKPAHRAKRDRPVTINRDHARPRQTPRPSDAEIDARLTELVSPAVYTLLAEYRRLGLRQRVLTLPVTVALVLTLIWRQVPSVSELVRLAAREPLLWLQESVTVSQQAVDLRLRTLPADLFATLLAQLLPLIQERATARTRPIRPVLRDLQPTFPRIWAVDASTLEALFTKVGLLRERPGTVLGGTMLALLDVVTRLPVRLWFDPDPRANEKRFLPLVLAALEPGTLLLADRGFYQFAFFDALTERGVGFVTRAREVAAFTVQDVLHESPHLQDRIITFGQYRSNPCQHPVRLIELQIGTRWQRYLTNVLDPDHLSPLAIGDLYAQRWRIEDAFREVKRLLGLAYLWTGSVNGLQLQLWATWLLYAVLVDLADAVAEALGRPLDQISLEMVFRGLYHFTVAATQGKARDPVTYFAAPENADLGTVKRPRLARQHQRQRTLDTLRLELNL